MSWSDVLSEVPWGKVIPIAVAAVGTAVGVGGGAKLQGGETDHWRETASMLNAQIDDLKAERDDAQDRADTCHDQLTEHLRGMIFP